MNDESNSRILIVDDSEVSRRVIGRILDSEFTTLFATGGAEALEKANDEVPDLILLDLVMPEMDGLEVCRAIKNDDKLSHIPVIFVTSMNDESNEEAGLAAGACDYITKPVNPAIVLARVKIHLQNQMYAQFLESLLSTKQLQLDEVREEAALLQEFVIAQQKADH